jgi:hypothetical protein
VTRRAQFALLAIVLVALGTAAVPLLARGPGTPPRPLLVGSGDRAVRARLLTGDPCIWNHDSGCMGSIR